MKEYNVKINIDLDINVEAENKEEAVYEALCSYFETDYFKPNEITDGLTSEAEIKEIY